MHVFTKMALFLLVATCAVILLVMGVEEAKTIPRAVVVAFAAVAKARFIQLAFARTALFVGEFHFIKWWGRHESVESVVDALLWRKPLFTLLVSPQIIAFMMGTIIDPLEPTSFPLMREIPWVATAATIPITMLIAKGLQPHIQLGV